MQVKLISTHNTDNEFGYILQEMHAIGEIFEVTNAKGTEPDCYKDTTEDPWCYHKDDLKFLEDNKPAREIVQTTETSLYHLIKSLHEEIKNMRPDDGFSSPRDVTLVRDVNAKAAILDKLQEAMRIINPDFDIKA